MSSVVAEANIHQRHSGGGVPAHAPAHKEGAARADATATGVSILPDAAISALGKAVG
jgi:hypothetical protein